MNTKQQTVLNLLTNAQLISNEMKSRVQLGIRHFNEKQLDDILVIIQEALKKQQELLLLDAVKKNPNLARDMKKIIKDEVQRDREDQETADRKKEAEEFDFDSELESVFNDIKK